MTVLLATTTKLMGRLSRKVGRLAQSAALFPRPAEFAFPWMRGPQTPKLIWCFPRMSCTSSDPVKRFLLFQIFPEMPPPAGVNEFTAAAEAPPMAMGPDGLPAKSVRSGVRVGSRAGESYQNTARENP